MFRITNRMYSPRRILLIVVGLAIFWLVQYVPSEIFEEEERGVTFGKKDDDVSQMDGFKAKTRTKEKERIAWKSQNAAVWAKRGKSVKEAFLHAYGGYEKYAPFPHDELLPLTNGSTNNFNGWGLTMVDSLDTMLLLGLKHEFQRALENVEKLDFSLPIGVYAQFFETVIRYLGGLLSAYALSDEPILLQKADELASKLLPVFNTSSGMPMYAVNPKTKQTNNKGGTNMLFAEIASFQMEFKYLAWLTRREEYFEKADRVMDHLKITQSEHGMWSTVFDIETGKPSNEHFSVGAWADSGYEYLLKQYLLSGKTEHRMANMYMKAMQGVLENLIYISHKRNLMYITDTHGEMPTRKFEHLSCFLPGLLALGTATLPSTIMSPAAKELHMWAAEGLAHTCWVMYADQPSGLGPEVAMFHGNLHGEGLPGYPSSDASHEVWFRHLEEWEEDGRPGGKPPGVGDAGSPLIHGSKEDADYILFAPSYLLRPETLESMYVMYRTTKDPKWRERGWQIWEAIAKNTVTWSGFASVYGVDAVHPPREDSMPSYFLAETIKYAYLLTLDQDPWPADEYVFNTEAHPFPIFRWDKKTRQRYGVDERPTLH